jgi:hypothetical protein
MLTAPSEENGLTDLVAKRRFERLRKLLPKLRLEYPSDPEILVLAKLAKLAEVDNRFGDHVRHIILDAHLSDASFRTLSTPKVRSTLTTIARQAASLRALLEEIDAGSRGSRQRAGLMLEQELGKLQEGAFLLPEYVLCLKQLGDAAQRTAGSVKSKRGPKGAGGNFAFNLFVESLLMAAWQRGGDWTVGRHKDGTWRGTLLEALAILKPYLPGGFFPGGDLGRAVEHIRMQFGKHITESPRVGR